MAEETLRCSDCGRKYRARSYDPNQTYHCRRCNGVLQPTSPNGAYEFTIDRGPAAGQAPAAEIDPLVGREVGPYRIIEKLGEGGMGVVYKAEHTGLRRLSALKVLPPEKAARSERVAQRFLREARAAAALDHPNIVRVFHVGEADGWRFIDMQYIEGESLQDRLEREGRLRVREATRILIDVANALAEAHGQNIVHRDIKPGNVLLDAQGRVYVADFGLAKHVTTDDPDSLITLEGRGGLGTPSFMSPEQCDGLPLDGRGDIYSLGVTYYCLLTGDVPFKTDPTGTVEYKHRTAAVPDPRRRAADIPEAACRVITKAMAKQPPDRYQTCEEMAADLTALAEGGAAIALPSGLALTKGSKLKWGNPVGEGSDPASGLPWEVALGDSGMPLILCPAGEFMMGSEKGYSTEKPVHKVRITEPFYMGKYEVTNKQFHEFVDANPQWGKGRIDPKYHNRHYLKHWTGDAYPSDKADHPVVYVTWFAAKAYCEWAGGRLPTEAEWEYACRAGSTTNYCFGDSATEAGFLGIGERDVLGEYAWYLTKSGAGPHPVGQKKPNEWGIYDMHGNVWEWCSSKDQPYPYKPDDGREDLNDTGSRRVLRGGGRLNIGFFRVIDCRSACRNGNSPSYCSYDHGFRVAWSARAPR